MVRVLAVLLVVALFLTVLPAQEDGDLKVLDEYEYDYGRSYNLNEFDCTNSSQIAWYVLRQRGFDARLI